MTLIESMPNHSVASELTVCIAGKSVGPRAAPFVIAEAGVNHNGDEELALRLVDAACEAGADAVKFQVFVAKSLTIEDAPTADYQSKRTRHQSQRTMLAGLELSDDALRRIARHCADRGIIFFGTPFSSADVRRLIDANTAAIKIASTDMTDVALLESACGTHLPIILSTGAAKQDEIASAVDLIDRMGARRRLILLHCVSAYPTPLTVANLRRIARLRRRFSTIVGYSDHTASTMTGALAVAAGACMLEKHFTLDRSAEGPDHALSLEPAGLADYVALVREAATAMGDGLLDFQPIEQEVRTLARKSIVAACDIQPGAVIERAMLTSKRAGRGLPSGATSNLIGRRAKRAIVADTPLEWEMIE